MTCVSLLLKNQQGKKKKDSFNDKKPLFINSENVIPDRVVTINYGRLGRLKISRQFLTITLSLGIIFPLHVLQDPAKGTHLL